jgi:hypothetical protein
VQPENRNKHLDWQKVHIIKVYEQTCTYGLYQEHLLPCCHALTALYASKISLHDGFDLIPSWFEPIIVLGAYDYLSQDQNEFGEDVMVHIGLQAIYITRFDEYTTGSTDLDLDDPFRDIVVEPPPVPKKRGKQQKRREAGDEKDPLQKVQRQQVCSQCDQLGHNKKQQISKLPSIHPLPPATNLTALGS